GRSAQIRSSRTPSFRSRCTYPSQSLQSTMTKKTVIVDQSDYLGRSAQIRSSRTPSFRSRCTYPSQSLQSTMTKKTVIVD
ncbi:MAG: hypothetical protein GX319_03550, partial [Clostridiales bacterium]|nr:hypothetical protein [Clostridiales bacterium]